jgi:hypothetical protein
MILANVPRADAAATASHHSLGRAVQGETYSDVILKLVKIEGRV